MARNFRYYEKKRGHRRTGSRTIGSAGEAVFFGALLVLGCAGLVVGFLFLIIPEWRVNHGFIEHTCRVIKAEVGETRGDDGLLYRPEIKIEYQVNGINYPVTTYDIGREYRADREKVQAIVNSFVKGQTCACWYDPANPRVAVLVRGYHWWTWLAFIVPMSFVALGAGGLIYAIFHWGKSAECRAAMARRAVPNEAREMVASTEPPLSNVPDGSDITISPGTKLAFRLPLAASPAWMLFGLLVACLLWNGAVAMFAVMAVRSHLQGQPDWLLSVFIVPFLLVGIGLAVFFVRQLLITTGVGPTLLEISAHPLLPGQSYQLFVSQSGRLKMNALGVFLVCEEEATYRQGTNTRTETREVFRQQVLHEGSFEIRQGEPFEAECALPMPPGAMHSFKAGHNRINWKVLVEGDVANWPDFQRSFPVIVYPMQGRTDS